jgi:hypothetical protein
VFRLFSIVDPDFDGFVPDQVKADLSLFLDKMRAESVDLKAMGLGSTTLESVDTELRSIYRLN